MREDRIWHERLHTMNKHLNWMTGALIAVSLFVSACQPGMSGNDMSGGDMGGMEMGGGPNEGKVAATAGSIEIVDPWARSSTMEGGNSAIYMMLRNTSDTADKLIGVSGDIADAVEIHETTMDNGVMSMHPVEGGLEVPGKGSVELKPGSYHVMLIGLTKALKAGDMVTVKLEFESGASVELMAPVMDPK